MTNLPAHPLDLQLTRKYQATPKRVFEAFTQAEHLVHWWAPGGFTMPVCKVDLRAGGNWDYTFRAPNGWEHVCNAVYIEVDPTKKLIMESMVPDKDGKPIFKIRQTFLFEREGEGTEVHVDVNVLQANPGSEPYLQGMREGFNQTLGNLVGYLAK
jgi:uncharacterized protein YndB with AHSA1/START domain